MALIKLRNLAPSQIQDYTGRNLIAVALNDENLPNETRTFDCGTLISGMMLEFSGNANFANFQHGLQISGEQVATGKVDLPQMGGEQILSQGNNGDIVFGGSDPGNKKDIRFTHGGDDRLVIHDGGVDIVPSLKVNNKNVLVEGDNISLLQNDENYITLDDIPEDVSTFTNDAGYLTETSLPNALTNTISVGTLTLQNGTENLGTFVSSTDSVIDINIPKYDDLEVAFVDSDESLKENLIRLENPLSKISRINGYNFTWNENAKEEKVGEKDVGVIAQEIEQILPEAVKDVDGSLKVAYHKIIPLLIECIKVQEKRIKKLEKK